VACFLKYKYMDGTESGSQAQAEWRCLSYPRASISFKLQVHNFSAASGCRILLPLCVRIRSEIQCHVIIEVEVSQNTLERIKTRQLIVEIEQFQGILHGLTRCGRCLHLTFWTFYTNLVQASESDNSEGVDEASFISSSSSIAIVLVCWATLTSTLRSSTKRRSLTASRHKGRHASVAKFGYFGLKASSSRKAPFSACRSVPRFLWPHSMIFLRTWSVRSSGLLAKWHSATLAFRVAKIQAVTHTQPSKSCLYRCSTLPSKYSCVRSSNAMNGKVPMHGKSDGRGCPNQ